MTTRAAQSLPIFGAAAGCCIRIGRLMTRASGCSLRPTLWCVSEVYILSTSFGFLSSAFILWCSFVGHMRAQPRIELIHCVAA